MHDMAAFGRYCSHTCLANILKFDLCFVVKIIHHVAAILDSGLAEIMVCFDTKWQCMDFSAIVISWRRQFGRPIKNLSAINEVSFRELVK